MKVVNDRQGQLFGYLLVLILFGGLWSIYIAVGESGLLAYLACALYLMLGIVLWRNNFRGLIITFPFYFGYLGVVISSAYLEQGVYISEQEAFSFITGGTLRLVSYVAIFLGVAVAVFSKSKLNIHYLRENLVAKDAESLGVRVVLLLVFIFLLVLSLGLLHYGSPVVMGVTRFEYWAQHPFPGLWNFQIQLSQLAFLLGGAHALSTNPILKRKITVLFGVILLMNFLYADKFSSNMLCIMNFASAYLLVQMVLHGRKPKISKLLKVAIPLGIFFYFLIGWSYESLHGIAAEEVADYIFQRAFALQGHTWWGIDSLLAQGSAPIGVEYLFSENTNERPGGLYLLMYAIAPATRVDWYLEHGISFTMGGMALPVYTLGYLGALPYVLAAGVLVGVCARYIEEKLLKQQFLRTLVGIKIMWIFVMAFSMGNPYLLFGVGPAAYLFVVVFDKLVLQGRDFVFLRSSRMSNCG